jgi:hypothetical protein
LESGQSATGARLQVADRDGIRLELGYEPERPDAQQVARDEERKISDVCRRDARQSAMRQSGTGKAMLAVHVLTDRGMACIAPA